MLRPPALQRFIDCLETALVPRVNDRPIERTLVATLFGNLARPAPFDAAVRAVDRPPAGMLERALERVGNGDRSLHALAVAFAALEPLIPWLRGRKHLGPDAPIDLHAVIVGPHGLEPRTDAEIGVTLMAEDSTYIDHHHPPDEVYLVLSAGRWRHAADPWFEPGIGGVVYNRPHIVHNMQATGSPLFAFWCLPSASETAIGTRGPSTATARA